MAFPMSIKHWLTIVLPQKSKKNNRKLQMLKEHIEKLCTDVLTPLCNTGKDIELPSELKDNIDTFVAYA